MESNLEIAILGGCIAAGTIFFTILLIRRLCDLIIFLLFATAVLSPFVL